MLSVAQELQMEGWRPSDYAVVATIACALLAAVVALSICLFNRQCAKLDGRNREVGDLLRQLQSTASEVSELVVFHLTWAAGRKDRAEIYPLLRRAMTTSDTLEALIPALKDELSKQCALWHDQITAHFPVDFKKHAFRENGAEVQNVRKAMESYSHFLAELIASCVRGKLKI